jgi:hypothetical protein
MLDGGDDTEHLHPIDGKRGGKKPDLRMSYFTVLMCAKETLVCFIAAKPIRVLGRAVARWHLALTFALVLSE